MERRINKKINEFLGNYKTEVKDYILSCKDNIDGTIDNWDGKDTESMTSLKNIGEVYDNKDAQQQLTTTS